MRAEDADRAPARVSRTRSWRPATPMISVNLACGRRRIRDWRSSVEWMSPSTEIGFGQRLAVNASA